MKYLVMETRPAYAVVLDQEGRFFKAANFHYQVGQTVEDIVPLRLPEKRKQPWARALAGAAGLAACLCLTFFGWYQPNFTPYGALRLQINPDVEMTLSRTERVLDLEGLNADGAALIAGYDFGGKDREETAADLIERAIDLGYLSGGDTVSITVTSADAGWQAREEEATRTQLEAEYGKNIVIRVGPPEEAPPEEVVIPVTPDPQPQPETDPEPTTDPPQAPRPDDGDDDRGDDWDDDWDDNDRDDDDNDDDDWDDDNDDGSDDDNDDDDDDCSDDDDWDD